MTRLRNEDIAQIEAYLDSYNTHLRAATGHDLFGIGANAVGVSPETLQQTARTTTVHVVPITAGLGIISDFSQTVRTILNSLGFQASVANKPDVCGIAEAYEQKNNLLFMADDQRFIALNLSNNRVADNTPATAQGYVSALELMAGGLKEKEVLVIGCGPVGNNAVRRLIELKANVVVYDIDKKASQKTQQKFPNRSIEVVTTLPSSRKYTHIFEAAPATASIPEHIITDKTTIVAAGVPLGLNRSTRERLATRFIHDKLELGVTTMALSLLAHKSSGEKNG